MEIDVEQIVKQRIVIARLGEMDRMKWWNTKGLLSNLGEMAISRGFPKTHVFARCRAVFAVASARCNEVFNPPESYTLWRLPAEIEDRIEDGWASWLENPAPWKEFLEEVDKASTGKPVSALTGMHLLGNGLAEQASKLRRADDLRSVPIKLSGESISDAVSLLAGAHESCEPQKLAVPFIREEEFPK
ncbi:BrxE family protein [Crateriforma conspicua]|uniref:BrxE family protein n=1 Tax=Crateriforma conspicua TaxID=2527996 RepID=UPI00118891A1|nr:BrxE family protein [Crateriforma conspicua]QDV62030.1 hypothetical protein Mal65_11580 [Crateriforma conspicua]